MIQSVGVAVVVHRPGFHPPIPDLITRHIADSGRGLHLRVEFSAIDRMRVRRQEPRLVLDLLIGRVEGVRPVDRDCIGVGGG